MIIALTMLLVLILVCTVLLRIQLVTQLLVLTAAIFALLSNNKITQKRIQHNYEKNVYHNKKTINN